MSQQVLKLSLQKAWRIPRKLVSMASLMPSELAFRVEVAKHTCNLPTLSMADLAIVNALKQEGVFMTSLNALSLPSTAAMLKATESLLPKLSAFPDQRSGFDTHVGQADILDYPDLFLWGLNERLLNIVEHYIGLPVAFNDIQIRKDFANGVKAGSRLWHVDSYDHRILRIIIYLRDVTATDGPFEYISRQSTKLTLPILEQFGAIPDGVIEQFVSPVHINPCLGSAGTVVFASTSGILHHGTVPITSDRYILVFNYNSRQPKRPEEARPKLSRNRLISIASQLSHRQRECLLWAYSGDADTAKREKSLISDAPK